MRFVPPGSDLLEAQFELDDSPTRVRQVQLDRRRCASCRPSTPRPTIPLSPQTSSLLRPHRAILKHRTSPIIISPSSNLATSSPAALILLVALINYQLCSIPFENLDLHCSTAHQVCLDVDLVSVKTVGSRRGRGDLCLESSLLMTTVRRTLGYDVMSTGNRIDDASQRHKAKAGSLQDAAIDGSVRRSHDGMKSVGHCYGLVSVTSLSRSDLKCIRVPAIYLMQPICKDNLLVAFEFRGVRSM